jgi:hypothetical protein
LLKHNPDWGDFFCLCVYEEHLFVATKKKLITYDIITKTIIKEKKWVLNATDSDASAMVADFNTLVIASDTGYIWQYDLLLEEVS